MLTGESPIEGMWEEVDRLYGRAVWRRRAGLPGRADEAAEATDSLSRVKLARLVNFRAAPFPLSGLAMRVEEVAVVLAVISDPGRAGPMVDASAAMDGAWPVTVAELLAPLVPTSADLTRSNSFGRV